MSMTNIEDEEEEVVVIDIEPPKRKPIATLKVSDRSVAADLRQSDFS